MLKLAEILGIWPKGVRMPENYRWYADACADPNFRNKNINEIRFVVADTETTGLNAKKDQILSIGAVAVQNFSVMLADSFDARLQQQYFNNESIAVHEITPGSSANASDAGEVMTQFINYLQGAVFVAHNVKFDYQILSETLKRMLGFGLQNLFYDTMWLLPRVDDHFRHVSLVKPADFNLESLCRRYHLPIADQHTAVGDSLATAILFARLLKKLEMRGVRTLGDLLKRR